MLCDCVSGRCWEPLEEPHHGLVERFLFESSPVDEGCGDLEGRVYVDKSIFHLLTITIGHHRRPRRAGPRRHCGECRKIARPWRGFFVQQKKGLRSPLNFLHGCRKSKMTEKGELTEGISFPRSVRGNRLQKNRNSQSGLRPSCEFRFFEQPFVCAEKGLLGKRGA